MPKHFGIGLGLPYVMRMIHPKEELSIKQYFETWLGRKLVEVTVTAMLKLKILRGDLVFLDTHEGSQTKKVKNHWFRYIQILA